MYNLLVQGFPWKISKSSSKTYDLPVDRLFEYTDEELKNKFENGKSDDLSDLTKMDCLFVQEGVREDQRAYIGKIKSAKRYSTLVRIEYTFNDDVPFLSNQFIYQNKEHFGIIDDFEFSRKHWAVKNVPLFYVLYKMRYLERRPSIFKLPEYPSVDRDLVSVMMPFNKDFSGVYEAIKNASKDAGFSKCNRADNIWKNDAIIEDIVDLIDKAFLVVCDLTDSNPNVFYELGVAHAFGRHTVIIGQNVKDIPFDISHLRYIPYENTEKGLQDLKKALSNRMKTLREEARITN